ncbi:hypothetical protein ACOMHN_043614 [Nucella lapillus]
MPMSASWIEDCFLDGCLEIFLDGCLESFLQGHLEVAAVGEQVESEHTSTFSLHRICAWGGSCPLVIEAFFSSMAFRPRPPEGNYQGFVCSANVW